MNKKDVENTNITAVNPVGTIIHFFGLTAPEGYLACDGATYNREDYPELAEHLVSQFEDLVGDGETTFKVPDLRGEFLRGTGTNIHTGQGSGDNVGVHQDGTLILGVNSNLNSAGSTLTIATHVGGGAGNANFIGADNSFSVNNHYWVNVVGNKLSGYGLNFTTRPTNTSILYCIKY